MSIEYLFKADDDTLIDPKDVIKVRIKQLPTKDDEGHEFLVVFYEQTDYLHTIGFATKDDAQNYLDEYLLWRANQQIRNEHLAVATQLLAGMSSANSLSPNVNIANAIDRAAALIRAVNKEYF